MTRVPPFMGEFSDDDWAWFQAAGTRLKVPEGEAIIREGEPVEFLFVVLDGSFAVRSRGVMGMPPIRLGRGEIVGEMTYVKRNTRPLSSVVAREDSIVLRLTRAALDDKLAADEGFEARFNKVVSEFVVHRLYGSWVPRVQPTPEEPGPHERRRADEVVAAPPAPGEPSDPPGPEARSGAEEPAGPSPKPRRRKKPRPPEPPDPASAEPTPEERVWIMIRKMLDGDV